MALAAGEDTVPRVLQGGWGGGGPTNSRAPTRDGSGEQDSEMELKEATGRGAALAPTRVVPAGWDAARAEGG